MIIVKDEKRSMRWKRNWAERKLRVRAFRTRFSIEQLWNDNLNRKLEAKINVTGLC